MRSPIVLVDEPPGSARAKACLGAYYRELASRFEGGFNAADGAYAGNGVGRETRFILALSEGEVVGCGSLILDGGPAGEIKRMWVAPQARGLGIARRLLTRLEDIARQEGLASLRLDTNKALPEAHALYRSAGYAEIARYSDNPYAHFWFGKDL